MTDNIRVRFAPSPTGPLHIGGVRTALYNYLLAKQLAGSFILRIEDTDQNRFVEGAEKYIVESLNWCGLTPDEGPEQGGKYGPYRQSERKHLYNKYIEILIEGGHAYYAFDTPEELEALRKKMEAEKAENTSYCQANRMGMCNSLSLSQTETTELIQSGHPYVVRMKMPENQIVEVDDIIRGRIKVNTNILDDKVLFKSDGMPTYHLANIVDDHLMEITHVIRGEEWLPSLPLHASLYRAFGWKMPVFAHLPLLLKPDGKGKLSKRDGDKMGFPVFPLSWVSPDGDTFSGYREAGYLPQAFINMLALLGWNPGTEQEIFNMDGLVSSFSLERVHKSGAKFDPVKAKWFNHQYIINLPNSEVAKVFAADLEKRNIFPDAGFLERVCELIKDRITFLYEAWSQAFFFFEPPAEYDEEVVKKRWKPTTGSILNELTVELTNLQDFRADVIKEKLEAFCNGKEYGFGQVMIGIRLCLVGSASGPDLFTIMEMIGKEACVERMQKGVSTLG